VHRIEADGVTCPCSTRVRARRCSCCTKGSDEHVDAPWRYVRVEGASHWLQLDQPGRVNELLLDFLVSA
jgi:pimeloyl-ACP methyl ester carboxylesterase